MSKLDKDGEYEDYYDEVIGDDADGYNEGDNMEGENEESSFYNDLIDALNNASDQVCNHQKHMKKMKKYRDAIRDLSNEQLDDVTDM